MKIDRRSGGDERRILTAMIVDTTVLAKTAARWVPAEGYFASTWANTVAGWCIEYHERYGKAPGTAIEGMFEHWAEKGNRDAATVKSVEYLLSGLSDEHEQLKHDTNPEYILDLAGRHFNKVRLQKIKDGLEGDLDNGDLEAAEQRIAGDNKIELGGGSGIDVMSDETAVRAAFEVTREPLVTYPGAVGEFFAHHLQRNGFIAFEGAEKRGKTYWMLDLAWRAMCQRRRVAFFEVGDLTEGEIILRWACRAARHPLRPGTARVPREISYCGEGVAEVVYREKVFQEELDWRAAYKAMGVVTKTHVRSKESFFRLSTHPADSINVAGVRAIVYGWIRQGWVPDVICIDYADILAAPAGGYEGRDAINKSWMQMNGLRQELHCLVVTATQADAASYDQHTLSRKNFSEDKRKMAHVTGMVGLNSMPVEKEAGITRLNWLQLRGGRFDERRCVHVAGSLDIGNPAMVSTW